MSGLEEQTVASNTSSLQGSEAPGSPRSVSPTSAPKPAPQVVVPLVPHKFPAGPQEPAGPAAPEHVLQPGSLRCHEAAQQSDLGASQLAAPDGVGQVLPDSVSTEGEAPWSRLVHGAFQLWAQLWSGQPDIKILWVRS